jgi:hypothetical protein
MKTLFTLLTTALMLSSLSACQSQSTLMPVAPAMLQAQASSRVIFHVVPESKAKVWHVKLQRNPAPVATFSTKEAAVAAGRSLAKAQPLGQLIVHLANGRIETEYTYGNDPANSAG